LVVLYRVRGENKIYLFVLANKVGICCLWLGAQTADTDCDYLKQLKHFTTVSAFCFDLNKTVLISVFICFILTAWTDLAIHTYRSGERQGLAPAEIVTA